MSYTDYTVFEGMDETGGNWKFRGVYHADDPQQALTDYLQGSNDPGQFMVVATRFVTVFQQKQETVTTMERLDVPINTRVSEDPHALEEEEA
jgi:hypothetical protein